MVKIEKSKDVGRIRISHNKKLFFAIILLAVLIVILLVIIRIKERQEAACKIDNDCVKQRVTCCPCNMGGREECMTKGEAKLQEEELKECQEGLMCIAVYNCQNTECKCKQGNCTEE